MFDATPARDTPLMQSPAFTAALRLCGENPIVLLSGLVLLHRRVLGVPVLMLPRAAPPADLDRHLRTRQSALAPYPVLYDCAARNSLRSCTCIQTLARRARRYIRNGAIS
mgnify:CR=1 FL=1